MARVKNVAVVGGGGDAEGETVWYHCMRPFSLGGLSGSFWSPWEDWERRKHIMDLKKPGSGLGVDGIYSHRGEPS